MKNDRITKKNNRINPEKKVNGNNDSRVSLTDKRKPELNCIS